MGLREAKKQKTRKAISDLATRLFIKRGYNNVTTAEIAELAEVSVPTLFKYFPTKESLVFDEDSEREEDLVNIVINRKKDQSILDALLEAGLRELNEMTKIHPKEAQAFMKMVDETPELSSYAQQMWMRHEKTLASVIKKEAKKKMSTLEAEAIARFVLDSYHRSIRVSNSKATLKALFRILKDGWGE
jgi:AcrR family transcriptional regulator